MCKTKAGKFIFSLRSLKQTGEVMKLQKKGSLSFEAGKKNE